MIDLDLVGYCGVDCSSCIDFDTKKCPGCRASIGMLEEECPCVLCCLNKNIIICGQCDNYPCDDMKEFFLESESHMEAKIRISNIMSELRSRTE